MALERNKIIRTHKERVRAAEHFRKNVSRERISIIDREAYVECYLLEDMRRLYELRLQEALADDKIVTSFGVSAQINFIGQLTSLVEVLSSCIEAAKYIIKAGKYSLVWMAINESALMRASKKMEGMEQVLEMALKLDKELQEGRLKADEYLKALKEGKKENDRHIDNTRAVRGVKRNDAVPAAQMQSVASVVDSGATAEQLATLEMMREKANSTLKKLNPNK